MGYRFFFVGKFGGHRQMPLWKINIKYKYKYLYIIVRKFGKYT